MDMQDILDRLEAITQRFADAGFDAFTTLTFWDKRMGLHGGKYRMFIRANISGRGRKSSHELNVGGDDLGAMFAEFDQLVTRFINEDDMLAKTLGIEVAA